MYNTIVQIFSKVRLFESEVELRGMGKNRDLGVIDMWVVLEALRVDEVDEI